jgi:glutamyl-tRNA synthetase
MLKLYHQILTTYSGVQLMIKTRFAPSPTGFLHIGGIRTALFNYAYAKKNNGKFFLRIEDTDAERSTQDAIDKILNGMKWLGLQSDGEIIYQSQRKHRHQEVIQNLLESGRAYKCYCTSAELDVMRKACEQNNTKPRYNGTWRPESGKELPVPPERGPFVIRFKNPQSGVVEWNDLVKGNIVIHNEELDDLIIQRSDGSPTYNLSVVVDDMDMGITHVIRGDDHINNTPRQINIYKACNSSIPEYSHLSMILGDDGQKLSKRHGATGITEYEKMGYLSESINNYLARLGWSHGDTEIFSLEQMCQWFDFDSVTSSASQFDIKKLNWINNYYLKNKKYSEIKSSMSDGFKEMNFDEFKLSEIFDLYKDRCYTLQDFEINASLILNSTNLVNEDIKLKYLDDAAIQNLKNIAVSLNDSDFSLSSIEDIIKNYVKANNIKFPKIAMPLRVVILGTDQSPSIAHIIAIIGKEEFNKRLSKQIK